MSINRLYNTQRLKIKQLRPNERATSMCNMTWMMIGILQSKSVQVSKVATKIPGKADTSSITRCLSLFQIGYRFIGRLIANAGIAPVAFVPGASTKLSGSQVTDLYSLKS